MIARRLIPLVLVAITLATFSPILWNDFVIVDDLNWIAENPHLNAPGMDGASYYWQHPMEGLYVPVIYTYWNILARLGMHPALFHAGSIVLHLLSTLVVFEILRKLMAKDVMAMLGAMFFALHPMQVESVAWASGAKDLLAGLFGLVMIWQYLCYVQEGGHWRYVLAVVALIVAMLAKPSAVVAPVVAAVIDWLIVRKDLRAMLKTAWPILVMTVPCVIWSRWVQMSYSVIETPLWARPLIAGDALAFYLYKLVWPASLTVFYGRTPMWLMESSALWLTWIVPVALAMVLLLIRKHCTGLVAGAAVFAIALSPVLGFTPFSFQLYSTVADHYVYLAMFGVALAVTFSLRHRSTQIVCGVLLVILGFRSTLQTLHWHDSVTLMEHAAKATPASVPVQANLGLALARAGRPVEAITQFELVVAADPANPQAHVYLALALEQLGRLDEAAQHLATAIALQPNDAGLTIKLADIRRRLDSSTTKQ